MVTTTDGRRVVTTGHTPIVTGHTSLVTGNRVPRDYFIAKGAGESDITVHAGSYHLALRQAGIERCNIMTYSSILPGIARKIRRPKDPVHGSVMDTIMAVANGHRGEVTTAGLGCAWLYSRASGERYGGLVCEHQGAYSETAIRKKLMLSLQELYVNGFEEEYEMRGMTRHVVSFVPKKEFGTALVSICFTNYVHPIL
ncbi:MAG: arginine decarboxylase [Verrucomicrobia bacterium]|nr:arginine decarboxylase [Verrucomicrobiota bacterium]